MQEIWKDVKGYEGRYKVSSFGRVKSLIGKEKILKQYPNNKGYWQVGLYQNKRRFNVLVHRLVAEAFCEKRQNCDVINHLDNNNQNNYATNLEWTTQSGNIQHAQKQGRMCEENHIKASETRKKKCRCIETGKVYCSIVEAAKETGVCQSSIQLACNDKLKTAGGYHFAYERKESTQ